jgi:hypothetical protein
MKRLLLVIVAAVIPSLLAGQTGKGPYVLLGVLRRLEGHDFAFDAGVARHWQWHRDHRDPYVWYAWNIRFSERVGGLVFASFNHSAGSLDSAVSPAADWADWRATGAPHSEFTNLETYRYLPELSRGTGDPGPAILLEFTAIEVQPAAAGAFEAKLKAGQPSLKEETLWYRLVDRRAGAQVSPTASSAQVIGSARGRGRSGPCPGQVDDHPRQRGAVGFGAELNHRRCGRWTELAEAGELTFVSQPADSSSCAVAV